MTGPPSPDGENKRPSEPVELGKRPGPTTPAPAGIETVEQLVRDQLAKALGGKRGVLESAVPMATFTLTYVITDDVKVALIAAISLAVALLVLRIAQKSPTQFVFNAFFGIMIAAIFASRSGKAEDAFLPGIMYNAVYSVILILSIVLR